MPAVETGGIYLPVAFQSNTAVSENSQTTSAQSLTFHEKICMLPELRTVLKGLKIFFD